MTSPLASVAGVGDCSAAGCAGEGGAAGAAQDATRSARQDMAMTRTGMIFMTSCVRYRDDPRSRQLRGAEGLTGHPSPGVEQACSRGRENSTSSDLATSWSGGNMVKRRVLYGVWQVDL